MRPLPHSRCNATGSGTFSVSQSGTFNSVTIMSNFKSNGTFGREMDFASRMQAAVSGWLGRENQLVSSLVEERVSNLQVLRMVQAFVACVTMAVCASFSLGATVLSLLWFGISLYFCKKGGSL